ncbi:hypothetical protein [Arthrobacter gengyunqii]|uniref:Uncharacterized protein n=1 Tax=Arthrobacter gengyunqii TaxID=2886940 RepID=A0ABS8GLB9_9MICC|nr:hypothetical protein [Arthrobacter gengyunqii]MCC3266762.1 hypothetical protein [Arthrobacter gengyunqii]
MRFLIVLHTTGQDHRLHWQRDTPAYVTALDAQGVEQTLAEAVRYADMP